MKKYLHPVDALNGTSPTHIEHSTRQWNWVPTYVQALLVRVCDYFSLYPNTMSNINHSSSMNWVNMQISIVLLWLPIELMQIIYTSDVSVTLCEFHLQLTAPYVGDVWVFNVDLSFFFSISKDAKTFLHSSCISRRKHTLQQDIGFLFFMCSPAFDAASRHRGSPHAFKPKVFYQWTFTDVHTLACAFLREMLKRA